MLVKNLDFCAVPDLRMRNLSSDAPVSRMCHEVHVMAHPLMVSTSGHSASPAQLGPLVERLRLPDPAEVVCAALEMGAEDAAELQGRWLMPTATALPLPQKPLWRPPTLLPLPQTHQVTTPLAHRSASAHRRPHRTVRLRLRGRLGGQAKVVAWRI